VLRQTASPSRRFKSRIETLGGVWVYWRCGGGDDTSRVLNLGVGGLFIETRKPTVVGTKARLEFLVQEGQIRADAVVRHVQAGHGLGLKFTALSDEDRPRLAALMNRLGNLSREEPKAFWFPSPAAT
jgi:PilZ domain